MNLYINIEILNREFQSKLLIAMESASKGIKVYMGRLKPYLMRDFFVPGIVLLKSITPSSNRLEELKYYKKNNFIVTSLDEEVGLINLNKKYLKLRYSNESLELTDRVFAWGKFDYDNLTNKFKKHKNKFILSGNPRLDYWRKDFNFFFKSKKFKYNNFILFSFNFKLLSEKKFKSYLQFLKDAGYLNRGFTTTHFINGRKDIFKMFKEFSKLIAALSKKTDLKIIVRPHPADELKNYNFLKRLKNVNVINEGNISEWIYHAKIVVHSGCTGGLEASIRGLPTITYRPFTSAHGHKFADKYSIKTKTISECLNAIQKTIKKNYKIKKVNLKDFKSRAHNILTNKPGYKIIADEFVKLMKVSKIKDQNNDFFLNFKFKSRDIRSKLLNLEYGNIKFTFFDRGEIAETFEILKKKDPKFKDLSLNLIKKDIIQIKKSD